MEKVKNGAGVVLLVTLVFLLTASFPAGAEDPVGMARTAQNIVEVKRAGIARWRPLKLNDKIYVKDTIRTGENSRARIFFFDDSTISLGPITTLMIDEHLFKPAESYRDSKFKLFLGKARVQVRGFFSKGSKYEVHTPTAVAGVKGTRFTVWVKSPTMTTIGVTQGQVAVRNVSPAIVGEQILTRNLATDVPINKPPQTPKHMDKQQINNLQKDTLAKASGAGGAAKKAVVAGAPEGTPVAVGRGAGGPVARGTVQTNVVDTLPESSVQAAAEAQHPVSEPVVASSGGCEGEGEGEGSCP